DDALDIARQINVPEEHVLAAAEALRRRKQAAGDTVALAGLREEKRAVARQKRKIAFVATVAASVAVTVLAMGLMVAGFIGAVWAVFPLVLLTLCQGARAFALPVSDAEADRVQLPPVAGTCQVCGRPARASNSTLCEEHHFKTPGF